MNTREEWDMTLLRNRTRARLLPGLFAMCIGLLCAAPLSAAEAPASGSERAGKESLSDEVLLERIRKRRPQAAERLEQMRETRPELYERILNAMRERGGRMGPHGPPRQGTEAPGRPGGRGPRGAETGLGPPPMDPDAAERIRELRNASDELREEVHTLVQKRANAASDDEREAISDEIRTTVEEAFDLTTQRRELALEAASDRLEAARERVEAAREMLQRRKENRAEHIGSFMERLDRKGEGALNRRTRPRTPQTDEDGTPPPQNAME